MTLFILKSEGLSEILWDIHTSTYQFCRIEEKINKTTTLHKWISWSYRYIENIVDKSRNCSLGAISPLFYNILLPVVRCPCKPGTTRFSFRDKQLLEIECRDNESTVHLNGHTGIQHENTISHHYCVKECKNHILRMQNGKREQWDNMGYFKQKMPLSMCKMHRFRSSCPCAKYHPGFCSPFIHSVVSNDSVSGYWRPWSDCVDAQSDQGRRCPNMMEVTFSHGTAHIFT